MQSTLPPPSSRLQHAITACDKIRPTISTEPDSKESFDKLRSVLSKLRTALGIINGKKRVPSDDCRMEETFKELCSDIGGISTKLGIIAFTPSSFVDKFQMLEDRICALEGERDQTTFSYAQAVQNMSNSDI